MLKLLAHKIQTAGRVCSNSGWKGFAKVCWRKAIGYNWWKRRDHWLVGKWIELRGDFVEIDGCRFSVRNPEISTSFKSRFCFDRYEHPERIAIQKFLDPTLPVIELGASVGVVACLTNKRLRDPQQHLVVEANSALLPLLEYNRGLNNARFTIVHAAIGYGAAETIFYKNENFLASGAVIAEGTPVRVNTTSFADVARRGAFDSCTLICDIEGAEIDLVKQEIDCLKRAVRTLIIETHEKFLGGTSTRDMLSQLKEAGFEIVFEHKGTYVFQGHNSV